MEERIEELLTQAGWDALSDEDLMALILLPGSSPLHARRVARRILDGSGSLKRLKRELPSNLSRAGLGRRRSFAVQAAFQLAKRCNVRALPENRSFHSSLEIFSYFRPLLSDLKKECFWTILLDGKNRILRIDRTSEGCLTRSIVHPREVFRPALIEAAAAVLFVHNHPSGEPQPSHEDIQITQRLVETGKILGIRVLDHVIIGRYRYFSFADEGIL